MSTEEPSGDQPRDQLSLLFLKDTLNFDPSVLAFLAEVNEVVVYRAMINHAIARWQAEAILNALSIMYGTQASPHPYTMDTVRIVVLPDE